jgi:hypothetical protein
VPGKRVTPKKPRTRKAPPKKALQTNTVEKAKRNAEIVVDKTLGMTWPQIAAKHNMTARAAQMVYKQWRDDAMEAYNEDEALELAFDYKARFEAVEAKFAEIAASSINDSARVGALRSLVTTTVQRLALDQAVGRLPRNLGKLRVELDVRHVSQVVVATMKKHGVPEEAMREIQLALRGHDPTRN